MDTCGSRWKQATPSSQIATAPRLTRAAPTRFATSPRPPNRPRITSYSGTNTELSISRKGSRLCIGSTIASPVQSTASAMPQARVPHFGTRLCPATEPEYRSP